MSARFKSLSRRLLKGEIPTLSDTELCFCKVTQWYGKITYQLFRFVKDRIRLWTKYYTIDSGWVYFNKKSVLDLEIKISEFILIAYFFNKKLSYFKQLLHKKHIANKFENEKGREEWSTPPSLTLLEEKSPLEKRRRPKKGIENKPGDQASFPQRDNREGWVIHWEKASVVWASAVTSDTWKREWPLRKLGRR